MMREIKSQQMSGFTYVVAAHQQVFALFDDKRMDVPDRCTTSSLVDHVTKISGGIRQFLGAVLD